MSKQIEWTDELKAAIRNPHKSITAGLDADVLAAMEEAKQMGAVIEYISHVKMDWQTPIESVVWGWFEVYRVALDWEPPAEPARAKIVEVRPHLEGGMWCVDVPYGIGAPEVRYTVTDCGSIVGYRGCQYDGNGDVFSAPLFERDPNGYAVIRTDGLSVLFEVSE